MRIAILKKDALYWDYIEVEYNKRFKNQKVGAGNKPARMAVDALIIKYMLGSGVVKTGCSSAEAVSSSGYNTKLAFLI